MMSFFQNCVSFGGESFFNYQIEGVTPFQLMVKSIGRIITIERNVFPDVYSTSVCAMKLMGTILENHIGKIDEVLPDFIKLLHSELEANPTSKIYRSSILQTFSICFVYDTSLTYKCLEEQHISDPMLKFFFSSMGF